MADYLSIPLSTVPADWFETQAKARLRQLFSGTLKGGGILYLGVDSDEEGSFLLSRISRLEYHPWQFIESQVERSDPYLFWEQLVGNAEEIGLVQPNSLMLVEGGCFLPLEFLKLRANWLVKCATAHQWIIALPILNRHFSRLDTKGDAIGTLIVPPLQKYSHKEHKEMVKQLVQQATPSLEEDIQQRLVNDLLAANPTSRTLLQNWINFYTSQEDCLRTLNEEPPPPRLKGPPAIVPPTRQELKARFDTAHAKLNQASQLFENWLGYPLICEIEPLGDLFGSTEPAYWFTTMISTLYCYLIDKADLAFLPMTKYGVKNGKIEAIESPLFYKTVGRLRTVMQHGLVVGESSDSDTIHWVKSWYLKKIFDDSSPKRHHWRILTDSLIKEYDQAVSQLLQLVESLDTCDSMDLLVVRKNLEQQRRKLEKHTWRKLVRNSIEKFNAQLDTENFLERNLGEFRKQLNTSLANLASLQEEAGKIVEMAVLKEISKLQGGDLIKIGFPAEGPLLSKAKKYGNEEWEKLPFLTKEAVLELVKIKYCIRKD